MANTSHATFQQGDVVQLKSGGPSMTVRPVVGSPDLFFCQWFGRGNKLESAMVHASCLRSADSEPT
jgi:uncharacterized protein YodC (DUF2158 family)